MEQVGRRPWEKANSPFAVVNDIIGATRVYALGFGCGRPVTRDRDAEFDSVPTAAGDLINRLRDLSREIESLTSLSTEMLEHRFLPSAELWGTGITREISRREALVESIRHAALHLGELRLTRDLVMRGELASPLDL